MAEWDQLFKVFSDSTRLRILNLLNEAELNVNELIEVMEIQQSRVSKHLKILREFELVSERREGTWRFYSLENDSLDPQTIKLLNKVWEEQEYKNDKEKIKYVLEKRKLFAQDFFTGSQENISALGNFYSLENLLISFSFLIPPHSRILDGGCGEGKLLWLLAHNPDLKLYGIDIYKTVFQKAAFVKSDSEDLKNRVQMQKADITETPFENNFFDVIFTNMVLHHVPEPLRAFKEVSRILKPKGKWIIIDFFKHNKEEMRDSFKDFWLGFSLKDLNKFAEKQNLTIKTNFLIPAQKTGEEAMPDNLILFIEKNS